MGLYLSDICDIVETVPETREIRDRTAITGNELAAYICSKPAHKRERFSPQVVGKTKIYIGTRCVGGECKVDSRESACEGGKVIGTIHTHPHTTIPSPSLTDITIAVERNLSVSCILAKSGEGICYLFTPDAKRRMADYLDYIKGSRSAQEWAMTAARPDIRRKLQRWMDMPSCEFKLKPSKYASFRELPSVESGVSSLPVALVLGVAVIFVAAALYNYKSKPL